MASRTANRSLRIDSMEDRRLMAADVSPQIELTGHALVVEGTGADEQITFERLPGRIVPTRSDLVSSCSPYHRQPERLHVSVVDQVTNPTTLKRDFLAHRIDSLRIDAGDGDDRVVQFSEIPANIDGGAGDDGLYSQSAGQLRGGPGRDRFLMAPTDDGTGGMPVDQAVDEVRIQLHDGALKTLDLKSGPKGSWQAGAFAADEVGLLDQVFGQLQE